MWKNIFWTPQIENLLDIFYVSGPIEFPPRCRQDLPEGQLFRYFVYSRADFGVFRPAGATRCTDQG